MNKKLVKQVKRSFKEQFKIKPREEPFVQQYTKQVDITPWKYINHASVIICIIVIGVYVYFA